MPFSLATLQKGLYQFLASRSFEVHTASADGPELSILKLDAGISHVHCVPMSRKISPVRDLVSFWRLYRLIAKHRFHIVHSSTPKAGLLGMLASFIARTPGRVYTLRGLRLDTASTPTRWILWCMEWLTIHIAHVVIVISPGLAQKAISLGLSRAGKVRVISKGSSNGIDTKHFDRRQTGREARHRLGISQDVFVVGYVGRVTTDKGIKELAQAWKSLRTSADFNLLVVGDLEDASLLGPWKMLKGDKRVHLVGFQSDPRSYYEAMDVLVLPSYREGFGNVCLEAAAMQVPVIASDIVGCRDSVAAGVTGVLIEPRNPEAIVASVRALAGNDEMRRSMGSAGRQRASRDFSQDRIWDGIVEIYESLLNEATVARRPA